MGVVGDRVAILEGVGTGLATWRLLRLTRGRGAGAGRVGATGVRDTAQLAREHHAKVSIGDLAVDRGAASGGRHIHLHSEGLGC